jgi:hypothetical protein
MIQTVAHQPALLRPELFCRRLILAKLRGHPERRPGERDALAAGVVDHFGDRLPALLFRKEIDPRQFFSEGADVKIV